MPRLAELCPEFRHAFQRPEGWRWFGRDAEAEVLADLVECAQGDELPPGVEREWVRQKKRKQISIVSDGDRCLFVKRFRWTDPGARLRETFRLQGELLGFKGAVTECSRTLHAERRVGCVPRVQALGERVALGLVCEQVLVFDAHPGHVTLGDALEVARDDRERQLDQLRRAGDLALELDRAGLVHLDFNGKNVLLAPTGGGRDLVVDVEQLVDVEPGRWDVLAFVFGYLYLFRTRDIVSLEDYNAFAIPALEGALEGGRLPDRARGAYLHFQRQPLGRRARLRLARTGIDPRSTLAEEVDRRAAEASTASANGS